MGWKSLRSNADVLAKNACFHKADENVHIRAGAFGFVMDTVMCGVLFQNKNAISLAKTDWFESLSSEKSR